MNREFRIVLSDDLLPVQAFFNAISDDGFLGTLEAFSKGVGASFNDCHCEFPGDLDPEDEPIEGIQFALYEQEVVVSNAEFLEYLTDTCEAFLECKTEAKEDVERLLNVIITSMS